MVDFSRSVMKIGVLGAGIVSKQSHLPVLVNMPNVNVVWVCDKIETRARNLADAFKIPLVFTDLDHCPEVDAVLVAIPVGYRQDVMEKIFERKWHVFCEKPFAVKIKEHDAYLEKAKRAGVQVGVGLVRRYAKPTILARKIIASGVLGRIIGVKALEGLRLKRTGQESGWYMENPLVVGGGVLMETGSHLIDQVITILGASDFSIMDCRQRKYKGLDFSSSIKASLSIANQKDIDFVIEISRLDDLCNGIFIEFPNFILKVGLFFEESLEIVSRGSESICRFQLEQGAGTVIQGFYLEWMEFCSQCRTGSESGVSAESVRLTTSFIESCYEVAREA